MPQNGSQPLQPAEVLRLLAVVAAYHPPQDLGDATVAAWTQALLAGRVANLPDATAAVIRYYADPDNSDPWIKPWHVVRGVRDIRQERLRVGPKLPALSADLDPDNPAWAKIIADRLDAIADGRPVPARLRQIEGGDR